MPKVDIEKLKEEARQLRESNSTVHATDEQLKKHDRIMLNFDQLIKLAKQTKHKNENI